MQNCNCSELLTERRVAAIIQTNNKFYRRRLVNIDWNVKEYLKDFAFVPKYGEAVLDMIARAGDTGGGFRLRQWRADRQADRARLPGHRCGCLRVDAGPCQGAPPRHDVFASRCLHVPTAGAGGRHLQQRRTN